MGRAHPDFSRLTKDHELDAFREPRLGEVRQGGLLVGYLATQVDAVAYGRGTRKRHGRRWDDPREILHLSITSVGDRSPLPEWEDPWWTADEHRREIEALEQGTLLWVDNPGDPVTEYELVWLGPADQRRLWSEFGHEYPPTGIQVHL